MTTPKGSGIGGFDLGDWRDQVFAFDYDGAGKLDHLACYRPGTGTIWILKKVSENHNPDAFTAVYHQEPAQGIAGYNLADLRDRVFAFDYDGTGKLDHLACYRPGTGTIWILKKVSDSDSPDAFATVYHQGDPGQGIGNYNIAETKDQVFAFDYDGTGKLDHLVCYRPGTGTIWILKKVSGNDSPDAFSPVYQQGDPGQGIAGYNLADGRDQVFAFDYDGTGKLDHLACYRPGTGTIWILEKVSDNDSPDAFSAVYHQGDPGSGIGGFDLSDNRDRLFAFDYGGTGKLDHLVCYRPGTSTIWILKKVSDNDSPDAFLPVYPTDAVLPVYTTLTAKVSALFAALPDQNTNIAGKATRAALLNRLKGSTPGAFGSQGQLFYFRDVFFNFTPDPNAGSITPATGLGDDWWKAFSVVVICQAIYYVTSNTRNIISQPDVNNQVAASNRALQSAHVNLFYAGILAETPDTTAHAVFAQIAASGKRAEATRIYVSLLENPAWISAKVGQAASGQWTDQLWELLHHWLKLYALGMTPAQIDAVINALIAAGLPVPSNVGAGNWPSCALWLTPETIDWNDIRVEATPGMLDFAQNHPGLSIDIDDEWASRNFLTGQGPQWWNGTQPSSGSCFAAGAKVLMADGAFKNIEAITPGEMVQSITGPRAVTTAVSLRHRGDRLYSFAGTDMRFSATHPFLTHAGASGQSGPATAGVEPTRLMRTMPGLSSRGVASLGSSCPPLAGFARGVHPVRPGALQEHKVTPGTEMIYDLVTAFDAQGESHYCVGDGHTTFAVTSETARFATAPAAAAAIMDIMAAAWPTIARAMQPIADAEWHRVLDRALQGVAFTLFPMVAIADPSAVPLLMPEAWSTGAHLAANAHGLAAGLMIRGAQAAAASYDNDRGACLAAIVAVLGNLVRDAVAMGWRVFLGADAATEAPLQAISALSFEVTG